MKVEGGEFEFRPENNESSNDSTAFFSKEIEMEHAPLHIKVFIRCPKWDFGQKIVFRP